MRHAAFGLVFVVALGCKRDESPAPISPSPLPVFPATDAGAQLDPTDAAAPGVSPVDGGQAPAADAGPPGGPTTLEDASLELALTALAKKSAAGMAAEGEALSGTLTEGQHWPGLVTLQPNRCYTILAVASATVQDLEVRLLAPPFFTISAGEDESKGPLGIIGGGKKALCPALPLPISYKIDAQARKGNGAIRIRVYSRAK